MVQEPVEESSHGVQDLGENISKESETNLGEESVQINNQTELKENQVSGFNIIAAGKEDEGAQLVGKKVLETIEEETEEVEEIIEEIVIEEEEQVWKEEARGQKMEKEVAMKDTGKLVEEKAENVLVQQNDFMQEIAV